MRIHLSFFILAVFFTIAILCLIIYECMHSPLTLSAFLVLNTSSGNILHVEMVYCGKGRNGIVMSAFALLPLKGDI